MGAVVEEEPLVVEPGAEVPAQQGQDPVFRFNLPAQYAAQVREADEALQQVDLAVQVLDGPCHGVERLVGAVPEEAGALPQKLGRQAEQVQLPLRQAGQKAPPQQQGGLLRQGGDLPQDPLRVGRVRWDRAGVE